MNEHAFAFTVRSPEIRDRAKAAIARLPIEDREPWRVHVTRQKRTRTLEQNARMWAMLTDIARQCTFVVDGKPEHLSPEEVKDVMTAALRKHQRMAVGIDGGLVILGHHTSRMTVADMRDLIDLMFAFGVERGVQWSEP